VHFYELLDSKLSNDTAAMIHWFRKDNVELGTTPFLAVVDEGRLEDVIAELDPD